MSSDSYRLLTESYRDLFEAHGHSPKALGWTKGKQDLRFAQLTNEFDLQNAKILDVGCGFGDFVGFLQRKGIECFTYVGVDIMEEFVELGRREYGNRDISFQCSTLEEADLPDDFDFGIASGTFNQRTGADDCYAMVESILCKMFACCNTAISVDFLTDRVDYRYDHNFNYSPTRILEIAYSLSRRVSLKNDVFPFEFSVTIYRDDSFDPSTTMFRAFKKEKLNLPGAVE